jgi:predicted DNA-binding protein (UPF0251 family)
MASTMTPAGTTVADDLLPALHEEIARLPEKHRLAIVLCDLEGMTQSQAALELDWSERTLRRRLAEARERLLIRMARRGLARSGGMLNALARPWEGEPPGDPRRNPARTEPRPSRFTQGRLAALFLRESRAALPAAWGNATVRAALATVEQMVTAGAVSAGAAKLSHEVLQIMLVQKLKLALAAFVGAGLMACGASAALNWRGVNPRKRPRRLVRSSHERLRCPPCAMIQRPSGTDAERASMGRSGRPMASPWPAPRSSTARGGDTVMPSLP